jgi:V/A-type H+-transporting ATPase subunit C
MDKSSRFTAVNTKIAAMVGKLLTDEDYINMFKLSSPSEIAVYLKKNTAYSEFFIGDPSVMHRDEIERHLKEGFINFLDKLINYFTGEYRNFFKCYYMRYEIYDLKKAARLIHIEKSTDNMKDNLRFTGKYRYIDIDKISKSENVGELIKSLSDTVYGPYLKNLVDGNTNETLFRFEMALDTTFFNTLEQNIKKISKNDIASYYNIEGRYTDMLNLQWIYRGKKYFGLAPEEIFNYTINKGKVFNYRKIKKLCYASNIDEFIKMVKETPYAFMFKGDSTQDIFMERRINRYMYFKQKSMLKCFKPDISMVLAYMNLKEFEIRDIISIIENVRYKMSFDDAKKYLIKQV